MNRMFRIVDHICNVWTGCKHDCYPIKKGGRIIGYGCWARRLATTKLKHTEPYKHGFVPKFHAEKLKRHFRGGTVFPNSMGDMLGKWVPASQILQGFKWMAESPKAKFLIQTKNAPRFLKFKDEYPPNVILGATIETNRDHPRMSKAPLPSRRLAAMHLCHLKIPNSIHISVEPIIDFDTDEFVSSLRKIMPWAVSVGYDNWHAHLPEPSLVKTEEFMGRLSEFTTVIRKQLRKANWEISSH